MNAIPPNVWRRLQSKGPRPIGRGNPLRQMAQALLLTGLGLAPAPVAKAQSRTTAGAEYTLVPDVSYLEPSRAEKLDIYLPSGPSGAGRAVVLYIHGGGWTQGDKRLGVEKPICEALAGSGYAVVSINYQLNRPGGCEAFPQNVYDCKSALRFIRKEAATYGFDPDRVAVAGGSAGGHLALLLAYTPEVEELNRGGLYREYPAHVNCVIDLFGIPDVRRWGYRSFVGASAAPAERKRLLDLVSPITHVGAQSVPTLVIHGTKDRVVPFAQAEALVDRLRACAVPHRFVPVAEGEHAFPFTPHPRNHNTDLMPAVTAFLNENLRPQHP